MLFRVGLLLVRLALGSSEKLRGCAGLVETLEKLRCIPVHLLQEDTFMAEVETPGSSPLSRSFLQTMKGYENTVAVTSHLHLKAIKHTQLCDPIELRGRMLRHPPTHPNIVSRKNTKWLKLKLWQGPCVIHLKDRLNAKFQK